MPIGTALHERTFSLCESLNYREWAGYYAVSSYEPHHEHEYNAIRNAAALIDISPLFKYRVSGKDATRLVDRIVTRDVPKMKVGQVFYTPWCDEDGKVLDDGTVTRLAMNEYRVTSADPCYRWFLLNATSLDVDVTDVTEDLAALALQGRLSREVLEAATGEDWTDVRYFRHRRTSIADVDVSVTRTGYTGDRGYELWIPVAGAIAVWDGVFEAGEPYGIFPAGIRALDVARVEAGLILIDAEYTSARHAISPEQNYSPFEIGLGRLVEFGKEAAFTGKRALAAERAAGGPARRLVGLELDWAGVEAMFAKHGLAAMISPFVDRSPVPVYREGRQIGRATSITWGTTIKKMVGFGSLDKAHEKLGSRVSVEYSVEGERGKVAATVVPLPFLDLPRKRT